MNELEIHQHRLVSEKCTELLKFVFDDDRDIINSVLEKTQEIINEYNNKNLTIIDVSKAETGRWNATIKKVVKHRFLNPFLKKIDPPDTNLDFICESHKDYYSPKHPTLWCFDESNLCDSCLKQYNKNCFENDKFRDKKELVENEFRLACNKTVFDMDLKQKYILLNRKSPWSSRCEDPLGLAIRESIHIEILKTFQNQNKELLIKYT